MRHITNKFLFNFIKMSNKQSIPIHPPTISMWQIQNSNNNLKEIKVMLWNVNGFRSIIKKKTIIQFINQQKFDFICLNETKVDFKSYKQNQLNIFAQQLGYYQYWNFCKISSGYSGVMIYTKIKPIKVIEDFTKEMFHQNYHTNHLLQYSLEGRLLTLQYFNCFIINCYKPNSGSSLNRLKYRTNGYDILFNSMVKYLSQKKPVIILGDMNVAHNQIDLHNAKNHHYHAGFTKEQRQTFSQLLKGNIKDTFRFLHPNTISYTWWFYMRQSRQKNHGWRIDYILTDDRIIPNQAYIHHNIMGSDHCPISATLTIF